LFLGASISQLAAIRQARATGWRVVAIDGDASAIGLAAADVGETIDFTDVERVIPFADSQRVDAVVAKSTDRAVPAAATVADRLGLPGIGIETGCLMTNKAAMRARLAHHGVPQPCFAIIADSAESDGALESVGLPAVLKPVDSGGQRGVYRIENRAQLAQLFERALAHSRAREAILERYIHGSELNGIVVARRGTPTLITLSDRLRPPGAGFGVGWAHLYPSQLS